jgi:hypothetical protein
VVEEMKSRFAPDDFEVTTERLQWAMKTFDITEQEVLRQTELWHDHEYKRAYFDWNRAWRRWFRQCEVYGTFKRPVKHRRPEEITTEQRKADILKFERDPLIRKALGK